MNMLKGFFTFGLCTALLLAGTPAFAVFLGDTAIYSATAVATDSSRPNVLFIIDNSYASLNTAQGEAYVPDVDNPYTGDKNPWDIYEVDNQGDFSKVAVANSTSDLENMTCTANSNIIKTTLLEWGTYAGAGTSTFPDLKFGACDTAPKGAVYALGNYLNYLQGTSSSGSTGTTTNTVIVTEDYLDAKGHTRTDNFILKANHTASADNHPGDGANWSDDWDVLSPSDHRAATDTWAVGEEFVYSTDTTTTTTDGKSEREIIYDALKSVIGGTKSFVNFAAMTYGGNNSGGNLSIPCPI